MIENMLLLLLFTCFVMFKCHPIEDILKNGETVRDLISNTSGVNITNNHTANINNNISSNGNISNLSNNAFVSNSSLDKNIPSNLINNTLLSNSSINRNLIKNASLSNSSDVSSSLNNTAINPTNQNNSLSKTNDSLSLTNKSLDIINNKHIVDVANLTNNNDVSFSNFTDKYNDSLPGNKTLVSLNDTKDARLNDTTETNVTKDDDQKKKKYKEHIYSFESRLLNGHSSSREDVINGKNHASFSSFAGSMSKQEYGTAGDSDKLNGTRSVTKVNETREFDMGNRSYALTNLSSIHNCSGCMRDSNGGVASLHSYKGGDAMTQQTDSKEEGSGSGEDENRSHKKCKIKSNEADIFDMFSSDDDDDDESNIICVPASRRRLITNNRTHRKTTHSNGTTNEKDKNSTTVEKTKEDDKKEEEKNEERQETNNERAKSNEDRAKELELTKYKILHGIHDEPAQVNEDNNRNFENQTMKLDPSMLPSNDTELVPSDANLIDAGVGIVGMGANVPEQQMNKTKVKSKKDKSDSKNKEIQNNSAPKNGSIARNETGIQNNTISKNDTKKVDKLPMKRILCFGDSITKGFYGNNKTLNPYSKRLEELLSDEKGTEYEVLTHGVGGACASKEMQNTLPNVLKEEAPLDLVVILAGTNDLLTENCSKDLDLYEGIKKLHDVVHTNGIKSVVVTIPEIAISVNGTKKMSRDDFKETWNEINQKLRLYVSTYKKTDEVMLCDLADEFARQGGEGGNTIKGMWADNIHPSVKGYDRIGEIIYKDIKGKF